MADKTKEVAHAPIPVGLGTKLGLIGAIVGTLATMLTTMLDGYHGQETKWFVIATSIITGITILGRMLQACAEILKGGVTTEPPVEATPVQHIKR